MYAFSNHIISNKTKQNIGDRYKRVVKCHVCICSPYHLQVVAALPPPLGLTVPAAPLAYWC